MIMATDARRGWVGGDWMRRVGKARREWIKDKSAVDGVSVGVDATMLPICLCQLIDQDKAMYLNRDIRSKNIR